MTYKELSNDELNRWAHEEIVGGCWHEKGRTRIFGGGGAFSTYVSVADCTKCDGDWTPFINPDYCADLNLARIVEMKIPKKTYAFYLNALDDTIGVHRGLALQQFKRHTATAEQRIRAVYKTMKGGSDD